MKRKKKPSLRRRRNPAQEVIEDLSWVELLSRLPSSEREKLRATILEALSKVSEDGEGKPDTSAGQMLVKMLASSFDFRGFGTNLQYLRMKGRDEDLKSLWVHPFSMPTLIFSHKKLPVLLITHPALRWNKTVLQEMKENMGILEPFLKGKIDGATG